MRVLSGVLILGVLVCGLAGAQTTHQVNLTGFVFDPDDLTIQVGDTVNWVWIDGLHNVVSGDGTPDGNFSSGAPTMGATFDVTFDDAFLQANPMPGNVYPYYCDIHLGFGMTAQIVVEAAAGPNFIRGDVDGDGSFNGLVDALYGLTFQFVGGDPPPCTEASDVDGDGSFNGLTDSVYALTHQFVMGPPPPAPYPDCGADPDVGSSLGCDMTPCP